MVKKLIFGVLPLFPNLQRVYKRIDCKLGNNGSEPFIPTGKWLRCGYLENVSYNTWNSVVYNNYYFNASDISSINFKKGSGSTNNIHCVCITKDKITTDYSPAINLDINNLILYDLILIWSTATNAGTFYVQP